VDGIERNKEANTCEDILIFTESTPMLADISMTDKPEGPAALSNSGMWDASKKRRHEGRWYFRKESWDEFEKENEQGTNRTYDHGSIAYSKKWRADDDSQL